MQDTLGVARLQPLRHGPGAALLAAAVGGAWIIAILAQATGGAALLHHHALIEDGPPPWMAVGLFLVGWQVMIAAMMVPASLPALRAVAGQTRPRARSSLFTFLAIFAAVWTAFGLLGFGGDVVIHEVVHRTAWLEERPWLIEAGVILLAGGYQLSPMKRARLAACRHPLGLPYEAGPSDTGAIRLSLQHGLDCLASSWALMLLMFATGFANLGWMFILTALMVYETMGRHGHRVAMVGGLVLILFAMVVAGASALAGS